MLRGWSEEWWLWFEPDWVKDQVITNEKLPDQQKSLLLLLAQEEDRKEGSSQGSEHHRKVCPVVREGSSLAMKPSFRNGRDTLF